MDLAPSTLADWINVTLTALVFLAGLPAVIVFLRDRRKAQDDRMVVTPQWHAANALWVEMAYTPAEPGRALVIKAKLLNPPGATLLQAGNAVEKNAPGHDPAYLDPLPVGKPVEWTVLGRRDGRWSARLLAHTASGPLRSVTVKVWVLTSPGHKRLTVHTRTISV